MPLEGQRTFVAPSSPLGRGALLVRAAADRLITLVSVHLDPIAKDRDAAGRVDMGLGRAAATVLREMFSRTARSASARELIDWLERAGITPGEPVVIAGDFNTVPSSWAIRAMAERYVDAAAAASASTGRPLRGTYRRVRLPFRPRIDFVFVSPGVRVVAAGTHRRTPGDHYPVLATLEVAP
jgi:endonuclease/exonuclease/phosphatase family metal-dependent hydrolase